MICNEFLCHAWRPLQEQDRARCCGWALAESVLAIRIYNFCREEGEVREGFMSSVWQRAGTEVGKQWLIAQLCRPRPQIKDLGCSEWSRATIQIRTCREMGLGVILAWTQHGPQGNCSYPWAPLQWSKSKTIPRLKAVIHTFLPCLHTQMHHELS